MELGNVQHTAYSARVMRTPHSEISENKMIEENATEALIKHSRRAELSISRNDDKANSFFKSPVNQIEDFCAAVAVRLEEYEQMVRAISDSRFSWRNLNNWPDLEAEKVLHLLRDD